MSNVVETCIGRIGVKRLRNQKLTLFKVIDAIQKGRHIRDDPKTLCHLEGLICLIDAIQDHLVEVDAVPEEKVFGPRSLYE
jgi:hypothetical protein